MISGISAVLPQIISNQSKGREVTTIAPLLVTFGMTKEEIAAKDQLLKIFPASKIIEFNSFGEIIHYDGPIIYIGHSSKDGIDYNGEIIQWIVISNIIKKSVSDNHYILGCNSEKITELTSHTRKHVMAFNFEIDALLGAYAISLSIAKEFGFNNIVHKLLNNLINRFIKIKNDPSKSLLMKLWGEEIYTTGQLFVALIAVLFPLVGATLDLLKVAIFVTSSAAVVAALWNIGDFAIHGGDPSALFYYLSVIITIMVNVISSEIYKLAWWKQAEGFSALSADTAKNAIASVAVVLLVAAALAYLAYYLSLFLCDVVDADNVYW